MFNLISKVFSASIILLVATSFSHAGWVDDGTVIEYQDGYDDASSSNDGYQNGASTEWNGTTGMNYGYGRSLWCTAHSVNLSYQQVGYRAGANQLSHYTHTKYSRKTFTWYTGYTPTEVQVQLQGTCSGKTSVNYSGGRADATASTNLTIVAGAFVSGSIDDVIKSCMSGTSTSSTSSFSGTSMATFTCVPYQEPYTFGMTDKCRIDYNMTLSASGERNRADSGAYNAEVELQVAVGNWNF